MVGWWVAGGELGGGVFGFPSLSFGDGEQEQKWPGWDVGVGGCRAFLLVWPVLGTVAGLNAGLFEELANEFPTFGAVILERLVGPLSRDQHPAPGNA